MRAKADRPAGKSEIKPVAYGYGRISKGAGPGEKEKLSPESQKAEHKKWFDYKLAPKGVLWGGSYMDVEKAKGKKDGVSGRTPFKCRPAGSVLHARLRRGDHVIFTDLSRGFRRFKDAIDTLETWHEQGVVIHFTRDGISTDNGMGLAMLRLMAVFVEWERQMIAERTREALKQRRRDGKAAAGGRPALGRKYEGRAGSRRQVEDAEERGLMARIVEAHDEKGLSFDDIYFAFLKANIRTRENKPWSKMRIHRGYRAEIRLRQSAPSAPTSRPGGSS